MLREVQVAIVSDLHLGTFGSHATEFCDYIKSINPKVLILNGDIIDMWQFKKSYFPKSHWEAVECLIDKASNGCDIYYLTGNHDDALRRFTDINIGNFKMLDKIVLNLDGKKYWVFHGDVFDASVNYSKWIAKLGGHAYDLLIRLNRIINLIRIKFNKAPLSFSKKVKANFKEAVKFISDFEHTAIDLAIENNYDYVVCGHIHQPTIKTVTQEKGSVTYMNSGDWVENLTALEYIDGAWSIYDHLHHLAESGINQIEPVKYRPTDTADVVDLVL